MRIVFAGTPEFALPSLRAAARHGQVVAVYTQPDRPAGRGRQLAASPIKQAALNMGLAVRQPSTLRSAQARAELAALQPDLMVVVAYGLILPAKILAIPRQGCWNVHASLLPRWRGAAPIQRAIEAGDAQTGVCLMRMDEGLDTGPVLLSLRTPIDADDTGGSLHNRLAELGAEVLGDALTLLKAGMRPAAIPQASAGVAYARKLEKSEARLDWNDAAEVLARKVRAFNPWPIAEADLAGERVRIHDARALASSHAAAPGTVLSANRDGIDVACGNGVLRLLIVQREGGRAIAAGDYLNARPSLRA
ncbi:MAG: methionyl-tRNA formyltransferase [Proteobacteria bacterium]|nr:methionyl-tRNA formyltransferase [Pseudomonadota bacterium]